MSRDAQEQPALSVCDGPEIHEDRHGVFRIQSRFTDKPRPLTHRAGNVSQSFTTKSHVYDQNISQNASCSLTALLPVMSYP